MPLFLDNNVLMGFIFETDNWNDKSLKVMNCSIKKFSSNTVKTECYSVFDKKIRIIRAEILKTIAEINRSKSIKLKKLLTLVNLFESKDVIMSYIKNNIQKDKITLTKGLRILLADMESGCLQNLRNLDNLITFFKRDRAYKEIYDIFDKDGLTQADLFDVEIILDAHHIGLQVNDLLLISGDYEHIVKRRSLIKNNTSLKDVIGLGEFNLE